LFKFLPIWKGFRSSHREPTLEQEEKKRRSRLQTQAKPGRSQARMRDPEAPPRSFRHPYPAARPVDEARDPERV
jgi:hypothetical protein